MRSLWRIGKNPSPQHFVKNTRVTQTDVARAAGVHNTTVSLALRNCPALPEETRHRIQAIAKDMGYCPDPVLQALVAYRNGQSQKRLPQVIAYVTNWDTKWGWRDDSEQLQYFTGAERRATECGYQLEHFSLADSSITQRRLGDILYHRGIKGMVLASHSPKQDLLCEIDWSRLSGIKIGSFPRLPALCRVMNDEHGGLRTALRKVLHAGYQRIGLVLPRGWDELAEQAWSSAFLIEQSLNPDATFLPILRRDAWAISTASEENEFGNATNAAALEGWIALHQPEVIMGWSSHCLRDLRMLGMALPRDVAFVDLSLEDATGYLAGVHHDREKTGQLAIDLLLSRLERNDNGLPRTPTTTLIESAWRNGDSLPKRSPQPLRKLRPAPDHRDSLRGDALIGAVQQAV